jgi:Bacterial Ig domain
MAYFECQGMSLWYGTPDAPAPTTSIEAGQAPTITVGVRPADASNHVEVLYSHNSGPTKVATATWLRNDVGAAAQYFLAQLPELRPGDRLTYVAVCRCAARQVPSPAEAAQLPTLLQVSDRPATIARAERLPDPIISPAGSGDRDIAAVPAKTGTAEAPDHRGEAAAGAGALTRPSLLAARPNHEQQEGTLGRSMGEPTIKLEANSSASVLSYDVPEPTSYSGRNYIAMEIDRDWFQASSIPAPPAPPASPAGGQVLSQSPTTNEPAALLATARRDPDTGTLRTITGQQLHSALASLTTDNLTEAAPPGQELAVVRSMFGTVTLQPTIPIHEPNGGKEPPDPPAGGGHTVLDLTITGPHGGDVISGASTGVTVSVTGTAHVTQGTGSISGVEVQVGTDGFDQATPAGPGNFSSWSLAKLVTSSGTFQVTARAKHSGGALVKERSVTISTVLTSEKPKDDTDTTPPALTITSPADASIVVLGQDRQLLLTVTGTATDAKSGVASVQLSIDGIDVPVTPMAADNFSTWTATASITGTGLHVIDARATDKAGNKSARTATVTANTQPPKAPLVERILLVESVRLSSYLGAYGAGRTIKTFSLLPGEKAKISVKTFRKTDTDAKQASSILDSFTQESADDFENSLQNEQSSKTGAQESSHYKVGAEVQASWGWGSAKVSAEASGGSNASREELAKNIAGATQKHAAKASAKRDVNVDTSYEVKVQTGEETAVEREIQNINVSRVLNFVFRQMNQEFITLLHLVDARIGYFRLDGFQDNGDGSKSPITNYQEATLSQLDGLLEQVIVKDRRQDVRDAIIHQLEHVFDYQDCHHTFVETAALTMGDGTELPNSGYLRVKKDLISTYKDATSGTTISVPGVILTAIMNVMRTDAILVEALLGQGEALDDYSKGLQAAAIKEKELANTSLQNGVAREQLAQQLVATKDSDAAKIFAEIYPPRARTVPILELVQGPSPDGSSVDAFH